MPIMKLNQNLIEQGIPLPDGVARLEACDQDFPGLYLELRATAPGQGTFYYRYKDDSKKTCHKRIGTAADISLADARKQAKILKGEIASGVDPKGDEKAKAKVLTFTEFFNEHYLPYVKPRKRSWKRDEELFRLRIQKVFGDKRLNEITRQQIQTFHTALLAEGLAPASCDHHIKLMKHAFNLAIDWDLLTEKNPAVRVPLFGVDNKVENYLDEEGLKKLLAVLVAAATPTAAIARFLLASSLRLNEVLSARWVDLNRQTRSLRVEAKTAKSKKGRAAVLSDSAMQVLDELDTEGKFEYIFVNPQTGTRYFSYRKAWLKFTHAAGCEHLRCHDLRHIGASHMINSGRTLYEVQQVLGHSNPSVTQRYAHLSTSSLQAAVASSSARIQAAMPIKRAVELPLLVDIAVSEPVEMAVAA